MKIIKIISFEDYFIHSKTKMKQKIEKKETFLKPYLFFKISSI
jgi:hypothetical protein